MQTAILRNEEHFFFRIAPFYKNGQKKKKDKFSPSEKALQLPNSTLEGKGRGKFTLSQKTEEMAYLVSSRSVPFRRRRRCCGRNRNWFPCNSVQFRVNV